MSSSAVRAYARVLKRAYLLEVLGEVVYGGVVRQGVGAADSAWEAFERTEAQMQVLLIAEIRRIHSTPPLACAVRLARWIGRLSAFAGHRLIGRIVQRVVAQRRYGRWAKQYMSKNPVLWSHLVAHEEAQLVYFEGRAS